MIAFIFLFVFRSLAGLHNGFGYAQNPKNRVATAIVLTLLAITSGVLLINKDIKDLWFFTEDIRRNLGYLACVLSIIGIWGVDNSFSKTIKFIPQDIHFWELIKTGGVTFVFLLGGWDFWMVAAHLYPALILHKGFVNYGGGHPFFYYGTDDTTGKTFNIPLLNIKVKREPLYVRLLLAVISVGFIIYKIVA